MTKWPVLLLIPLCLVRAQKSGADAGVNNILQVKRIYVSPLVGGDGATGLRELIIAGLDATKLFILTDDPDRADATLKGAADDKAFTDTFETSQNASGHENISKGNGGSRVTNRVTGIAFGDGASEGESHHIKERKHEAYAAVRLCNKDGDVLWSTTQESLGAKFRGASADVAARIARQLTIDYERERRIAHVGITTTSTGPPGVSVK